MTASARRPAIAGAAQRVQRLEDARAALAPIELMEASLRDAAADAGAPKLLEALDAIWIPQGLWRYGDPGRILAERLGAVGARTGLGAVSGHTVQQIVDRACNEIAAGRCQAVAIAGAESEYSRRRLKRRGIPLHWSEATAGEPDWRIGSDRFEPLPEPEMRAGVWRAPTLFALCDTALRHQRGWSPAEHRDRISRLWSALSAVAAGNPHAWIGRHVSADEIRTPTARNRWVSYPYTKLLTSNIAVDQGAALILCSAEAATRFGVERDRLVHLRAATEMNHVRSLSERDQLHHHPGLALAARRALELAGVDADDLRHIDLYSCFPFAVQAGAAALGLDAQDESRPLSVTGGLTFSGGPFGSYVLHAMARLVELLRESPGSLGLVGSLGGAFAKFAYGIYSTEPGEAATPAIEDVSAGVEASARRASPEAYRGPACVESYVVDVKRSGEPIARFSALTESGERVWGTSNDRSLTDALLADEDACGRGAVLRDGAIELR